MLMFAIVLLFLPVLLLLAFVLGVLTFVEVAFPGKRSVLAQHGLDKRQRAA